MKLMPRRTHLVAVGAAAALMAGGGMTAALAAGPGPGTPHSPPGAAYDSLVAPPPGGGFAYHQDQCFGCAGVTEFGNEINLTRGGSLTDVVVAMHNWGSAINSLPITLTLYDPPAAAPTLLVPQPPGSEIGSVTGSFDLPAAQPNGYPSESTIDFSQYLSSAGIVVPKTVVFGISFAASDAPALNVALSTSTQGTSAEGTPASSAISTGSDAFPGYVFVNTNAVSGWQVDAGNCSNPTSGTFEATYVYCGVDSSNGGVNGPPYAYAAAGNPDIPAVEFSVSKAPPPPPPGH